MPRRVDREGPIHQAVLECLRLYFPGAIIHHSPNEQAMSGLSREMAARITAKLKKMGMVPGFADLVVMWRSRMLLVEVKAGSAQSNSQREFQANAEANGVRYVLVRSVDDAAAAARSWKADVIGGRV